jgi:hypothetical protein
VTPASIRFVRWLALVSFNTRTICFTITTTTSINVYLGTYGLCDEVAAKMYNRWPFSSKIPSCGTSIACFTAAFVTESHTPLLLPFLSPTARTHREPRRAQDCECWTAQAPGKARLVLFLQACIRLHSHWATALSYLSKWHINR